MSRIPQEEIDRIKREVDLVALVRSKGIELKKHGSKDLVGFCPVSRRQKNAKLYHHAPQKLMALSSLRKRRLSDRFCHEVRRGFLSACF